MKSRTVCFDPGREEVQFFITGLNWNDLDRLISTDKPISILRLAAHQRIVEAYYIKPHIFHREKYVKTVHISEHKCTHPQLKEGQTLQSIRQFISDNKLTVTDFEIQMKDGLTISQPVFKDLLFSGGQANRVEIEAVIKKTGLPKTIIAALKSQPGRVIRINEDGKPEVRGEFESLKDYIRQRFIKGINA